MCFAEIRLVSLKSAIIIAAIDLGMFGNPPQKAQVNFESALVFLFDRIRTNSYAVARKSLQNISKMSLASVRGAHSAVPRCMALCRQVFKTKKRIWVV
jgi:hypothetical protein